MSQEFAVLCIVFVFSTGVLFWTSGTINRIKDVFGRIGLALLVTTVVRLAMLLFPPAEVQTDVYASTRQEYYDVINDARRSIWICQTWLPDFAIMNSILVDKARSGVDVRLMLSSFRPQSHIFSRIRGRRDIADSLVAMINVYQCATPLFEAGRKECLRFNWGHHPGWIAVIDGRDVFWGQTPVHIDNQGQDFLFHHDTVKGLHGAFWKVQFESMPMITIGKSISTPLSLDERKYTWGDGAGGGTSRVTDLINAIGDAGTKSVNTALYTVLPILVVMLMLFGALEWAYGRFSLMRMFIRWPGLMLASWGGHSVSHPSAF